MTPLHISPRATCGLALTVALAVVPLIRAHAAAGSVQIDSARVTLNGTSNVHPYEAATTTVKVTNVKVAPAPAGDFVDALTAPGVIEAFDIAIPVATLTSPREGLDKNMYKALKAEKFAEITFRLARIERRGEAPESFRGIGKLTIAGVEREVTLDLTIRQAPPAPEASATQALKLTVKGGLALVMTDYGITPPKAMLGMLKTDPKVTIAFETVLSVPVA
jgi:polyisoprenoid-binding protein YceI